MSQRVVLGFGPGKKPHPTAKWAVAVFIVAVGVLGIPEIATAQPSAPVASHSIHTLAPILAASPAPKTNGLARNSLAFGGLLLLVFGAALMYKDMRRWRFRQNRVVSQKYKPSLWHLNPGSNLSKRRGLSEHRHSGRLLTHHHTSYPALAFLLLICVVLAAAVTLSSQAATSTVSLTVLGPPPTQAATIDDPADGQHFGTNAQTIRGTCPSGLMVEIWRNGVFAGSTLCDVNNLYAVVVTLVPGADALVARDVDGLGQYGPDSGTVTVFYDAPPPPTPTPTPSSTTTPLPPARTTRPPTPRPPTPAPSAVPAIQTLLVTSSQHLYQGADTSTPVKWTVTLSGGHGPYRVTWEWGDGKTDTKTFAVTGPMQMSHLYDKSGTYQVTVRAVDALGHTALLQVVTVVNGPATPASFGQASANSDGGNLILVWPLLALTTLLVGSFWLGERHKLQTYPPLYH